jgi:polar amino acid transport system permease protein
MEPTASLGGQLYCACVAVRSVLRPARLSQPAAGRIALSCGDTGWGDEVARASSSPSRWRFARFRSAWSSGFSSPRQADEVRSLRAAANIYTTIFRGLPELLTIFMIYFGLQIAVREVAWH